MTIDDVEKSVYVGGIPYDTTEDSLRKTFSHYGHVINVKINNEGPGGKCYGFVTFTNPRSAVDAIKDMNGRTIGGRVVRVNEVKVRGGGGNTNREDFRRYFDRSLSDRNRDREYANYEDQHHRTRKRDWSEDRGRDRDRERGMVRENSHYQARDHSLERDRERSERISVEEDNRKHEQDRERERERDGDLGQSRDREVKRITRYLKSGKDDKDQETNQLNGYRFGDHRSREYSSDSRDNDNYEVEDELKDTNQELEELRKQVSEMEELVDDKQQLVSELQAKSKKLEDALTAAKELSSQRKVQLAKLSRCYLHMKNYNEKLKSSEQELQSLIDTTMVDVDDGAYLGFDDDVSRY